MPGCPTVAGALLPADQEYPKMLDAATLAAAPPPRICPSVAAAAAELNALLTTLDQRSDITDADLDSIGRRGEVLIDQIASTRSVSLSDVLTKLDTSRRLSARELWETRGMTDSAITDLRTLARREPAQWHALPALALILALPAAAWLLRGVLA